MPNTASKSMSLQPNPQHTLYMAMRADGTPSRAVDCASPYKLASLTVVPAAVEEVMVAEVYGG